MPILNLKRILRLCKTLWYQFPRLHFNIASKENLLKHKLKAKKLGHLDEKMAKNSYLCAIQSKNTSRSQKVIHKTQRMINSVLTNSTSGKKNLKKTNTSLRVVKNLKKTNTSLRVVKKP